MKNKPIYVIDGDLRLEIVKTEKWYVVSSLDVSGLYTQGKTIEEAIANARDAAETLAESRALMTSELAEAKPKKPAAKAGTAHPTRRKRQSVKA